MDSLKASDDAAAAVAVAPRVTLANIEAAIGQRWDFSLKTALEKMGMPITEESGLLSICALQMANGFMVVGKSAPASAANYDAALGRKFAYEDCIRQLWPLMGYALRDDLAQGYPGAGYPGAGYVVG